MSTDLLAEIRPAIDTVTDPCSVALGRPVGLAQMGVVRDIEVTGSGAVTVSIVLTDPMCPFWMRFDQDVRAAVLAVPGVSSCEVTLLDDVWAPDHDPRFRAWTSRHPAERRAELTLTQATVHRDVH